MSYIAEITIDPGHGGTDPGCINESLDLQEKAITLSYSLLLRDLLVTRGFKVTMTRTTDATVSLQGRCDVANNAKSQFFVCDHVNAGGGRGAEVYALPGGKAVDMAQKVGNKLASYMGIHGQLVKTDKQYHVLVHTDMPAILIEVGFIDSDDINKIHDHYDKLARLIYEGICDYYNVSYDLPQPQPQPQTPPPIPTPVPDRYYRVRKSWDDPKSQIIACKYPNLQGAKDTADAHVSEGYKVFDNDGNMIYDPSTKPQTPPPPVIPETPPAPQPVKHLILGEQPSGALIQAIRYITKKNPNFDRDIAASYFMTGALFKIDPVKAIAQAIKETNYFTYIRPDGTPSSVKPGQHNFCGLGVTSNDVPGNSFANIPEGVMAHYQHLWGYATTDNLPQGMTVVDLRFVLLGQVGKRGTAPNWEDLDGKWAVPGVGYGESILEIASAILQESSDIEVEGKPPESTTTTPTNPSQETTTPPPEVKKGLMAFLEALVDKLLSLVFGKK